MDKTARKRRFLLTIAAWVRELFRSAVSSAARQRREFRTIVTIMAAVGLPVLLACMLVAEDMRSDLSDLKPAQSSVSNGMPVIGWPDLDPRDGHAAQTRWPPQALVKMLGYMMDGYTPSRDGAQISMFILMPEAGHFLHPAHRIPEEMVEIWLNRPVWFKYRRLVWVSGLLTRANKTSDRDKALFSMRDALAVPAADQEIARWFVP